MGELCKWLDHHDCVPVNFDIERGKRRGARGADLVRRWCYRERVRAWLWRAM